MSVLTLLMITAYAVLLVFVIQRADQQKRGFRWLFVVLALGLLAGFLLTSERFEGLLPVFLALTFAGIITAFGSLLIEDLAGLNRRRWLRMWWGINGAWLGLTVVSAALTPTPLLGQPGWLELLVNQPAVFSLLAIIGWFATGAFLLGVCVYSFYSAVMPEVANRALFWLFSAAILFLSIFSVGSGIDLRLILGLPGLFLSAAAAVYAFTAYRLFDIRVTVELAGRLLLLVAFTTLFVLAALLVSSRINLDNRLQAALVLFIIALVFSTVYVVLRQVGEFVYYAAMSRRVIDPAVVTRIYSQEVAQAVDLAELVEAATTGVNRLLKIARSGLLLVSSTSGAGGTIELSVISGGALTRFKGEKVYLPREGALYQTLASEHKPVLQFDLEYSPRHRHITFAEQQFFRALQMSAYAPIVVDGVFIGILACGPKLNDSPYNARDLPLLVTLAQQTGVALRNARLVADLRHLNESAKALTEGVEAAKEQLEKLDSVKTDFVTIASHELRTPLAQIRGYTDIIDALNEQGMLDQDQLKGLVANLRKATERTEELISAMLDVSQLDVNAMDLRFAQTTPESVLRLAIEPLTDAIKQRKLTLSAKGLRGLPAIQADMQRLVQAFRNIIVNAIKFTADGGRIEIAAALQKAEAEDDVDHILVTIADTGVGIAEENLSLVFNKFYRTYDPSLHSTGAYKFQGAGPGLGLTIAKGVIEGHGGKIWAESPGHDEEKCPGTTFFVLLPLNPPESARRVMPFEGNSSKNI